MVGVLCGFVLNTNPKGLHRFEKHSTEWRFRESTLGDVVVLAIGKPSDGILKGIDLRDRILKMGFFSGLLAIGN